MLEILKCKIGVHKKGNWKPAVGGRNVRRCIYCDLILEEESIADKAHLRRPPLPQGKESDKWFKQ